MANPQQVKLLDQGPKVWNRWRESHPNVIADLSGIDVSGRNLTGVNLRGAKLRQA
jgi:uncharacterized protein YjbI with pentapeptide repeats